MPRLEMSNALKRKIRMDNIAELAIPTWDVVSEAIKAGNADEALDFLDYVRYEARDNNDTYCEMMEILITHIAKLGGEKEVYNIFYQRALPRIKNWLTTIPSVEDTLCRCVELQRAHHAVFKIVEEPDRYVVTYNPCGTGGRLRRAKQSLGLTKKAYPWSWGRAGIPYYCIHCCIQYETMAIEFRGYPIRVTVIGNKPEDPCVHLFYKKPELIPEEYFTKVGAKKDPSKFKK